MIEWPFDQTRTMPLYQTRTCGYSPTISKFGIVGVGLADGPCLWLCNPRYLAAGGAAVQVPSHGVPRRR